MTIRAENSIVRRNCLIFDDSLKRAGKMEMSSEEISRRMDTLNLFENYIENTTNTLNNFAEKIGWTLDKTMTVDIKEMVECPINKEHRILPSKLDVHCQTCILKQNGYDSTHSLYPSYKFLTSAQTLKIDKIIQMHILKSAYEESNSTLNIRLDPREVSQSIERYACDFTPDERRVLYDYAVMNTMLPYHDTKNYLIDVDVFNKANDKPKTELEILQEQRDLKRRRTAYRGKRVHTDRKSYIEVLREVVQGLTNSLSQDKFICPETSSNIAENISNNRLVFKYEGNRNYNTNPYTRWRDIKVEESKLLKYYEKKNYISHQEPSISGIQHLKYTDYKKSKNSRSRSRERRERKSSSEFKKSRKSRSRSKLRETKYIKSRCRSPMKSKKYDSNGTKFHSKSKETMYTKSRSRSVSIERKHKKPKRSEVQPLSKGTKFRRSRSRSILIESQHKRYNRHKSLSKSIEYSSRKSTKHSRSPINCYKSTLSNEKNTSVKSMLSENHKKKGHHKKKKKHAKSSKRSRKSKKSSSIEVYDNTDVNISKDNDEISPISDGSRL